MWKLILVAVVMVLAGCGTMGATPALQPAPVKTAFVGFATLASVNTFEWQAAPTWTRLAALRHNAARALGKQQITVDAAKSIQARADLARSFLDKATAADKRGNRNQAGDDLRWAIAAIEDAESTLKGTP